MPGWDASAFHQEIQPLRRWMNEVWDDMIFPPTYYEDKYLIMCHVLEGRRIMTSNKAAKLASKNKRSWSQKPGPEFFWRQNNMTSILTKSMMAKNYMVPWTDQRCSQDLIWPKIWRRIHCWYSGGPTNSIKACMKHSLHTMALLLGTKPPNCSNHPLPS